MIEENTLPTPDRVDTVESDETRQGAWAILTRLPFVPSFILLAFIILAIFADVIAPHNPYETSLRTRFRPPVWADGGSWGYPLGTDHLGRDVLTRVIYGARISLAAGVLTVSLAGCIGAAIGLLSGFYGGRIDGVLMRAADSKMRLRLRSRGHMQSVESAPPRPAPMTVQETPQDHSSRHRSPWTTRPKAVYRPSRCGCAESVTNH